MKKFVFSFVLFLLSFAGHVMANEEKNVSRQVKIQTPFSRLTIRGDVEIVLVNDSSSFVTIEGKVTDVAGVVIKNKNDRLVISSMRQNGGSRVVIRIPFQRYERISMYGNVSLHSMDVLKVDALKVFIDGACKVSLKVEGTVSVRHSDECEIEYYNRKGKPA
jgi:hypothetical protein